MVAVEPVPAGLLAELLELPVEQIEPLCDELAESCRAEGPRLRAGPDRRRVPHPDPPRPGPLRRAVRQRRACRPGCRPPRSRRWPSWPTSSRSPGPRSPPCAGSTSTAWSACSSTGATSPRSGRAAGPGQAVLYGTTDAFLERLGLDRLDQLPPVEDLLPGPEVAGRARGADAPGRRWLSRRPSPDRSSAPRRRTAAEGAGPDRASGSRRVCEELIADGRVTVNGEVAGPRAPGRSRRWTGSSSTGCPSRCRPGSSTTC